MPDKIQTAAPNEPGHISSWEDSPLNHLVRLTLLFLQSLFGSAPTGHFRWDEDEELSELILTKEFPMDSEVLHKRPAIIPVRSTAAFNGIGMDQLEYENQRTGERSHVDMVSGNLTFNCLSRVRDESEQIAWLSAKHIWLLRRVLLKLGFHDIGQRFQIGSPGPPGELVHGASKSEIICTPAWTSFQFHTSAKVLEEDVPILQKLEADLTARVAASYRPTNIKQEGGWGTGLVQVGGGPVEFQNIKGRIRAPSIRGRPATVTQVLGSNRPTEPLTIKVNIESDG